MIKSIRTADTRGKRVLLRVDYNVPLDKGKVTDDTRIEATLPTINYLLEENAKIIIATHLGRPEGKRVDDLKLDSVAKRLSDLIKRPVIKLDDCIGSDVEKAVNKMEPGEIVMLENVRFHSGEENNDNEFSKQLAKLGDVMIVDSFGTAHRKHSSTYGIAQFIPVYAGFLMEKEIHTLSGLMQNTPSPLTLIIGGAKIETKIGIIRNFLNKADYFLIGGGLGNTFLAAQGFNVGKSLYEEGKIDVAREIMLEAEVLQDKFILPEDVVVADEISDNAKTLDIPVRDVIGNMMILDLGIKSIEKYEKIISLSKTIIWNGPVGLFEKKKFSRGTERIAKAVSSAKHAKTIIGGGDTLEAVKAYDISLDRFTHASTGGGAMLAFLEGSKLPGVEIVTE